MFRKLSFLSILVGVVALAAFGGWRFGRQHAADSPSAPASGRKVLFYQSPMHPWIKSDQPGNCTICGMKLVPVLEGDAELGASGGSAVKLSALSTSVANIETATVTRQPLRRTIRVAGRIDDDDSTHRRLSAYVEGRIEKLFVNYVGAEVTAGQPLAAFFSRELLVARGEYDLALKQASKLQREDTLAASRQKLLRFGLTPGQVDKLPGQSGETFEIVAPITGTVVERKVYEGQYVKEGDVLFEIADFSKMWFVFDAYERDLAWIRVGQQVEVTTPSVPGKTFTAPIAFIDPNLSMETRTARIRVVLDNPLATDRAKHRHELHKVYADGRIHVETEPVLTVPRSAVLSPGGHAVVYLVKSEREYEPRRVTLGRVGDDVWEIVAGLQEGDRVVTTGNLLVDAQAQLERPTNAPAAIGADLRPLTDVQHAAAEKLFGAASAVAEALAADDLAQSNSRTPALHEAAMAAADVLGAAGARFAEGAHAGPAKDLKEARKRFYPLSMAVAELALRAGHERGTVKIYECPMAKSAVPSAETNQGRWVQLSGPIRNPFFGAEMLQCGREVQP